MMYYTTLPSPIGELLLIADGNVLCEIDFDGGGDRPGRSDWQKRPDHPVLKRTRRQLEEYFAGTRKTFDLPLAPRMGTPFQRRVWQALEAIPYGETQSYGEIARRIGSPKAVRAVGAANGANPIPIVVPCHRVIGANGTLTGYGGGLPRKQKLLALERSTG